MGLGTAPNEFPSRMGRQREGTALGGSLGTGSSDFPGIRTLVLAEHKMLETVSCGTLLLEGFPFYQ